MQFSFSRNQSGDIQLDRQTLRHNRRILKASDLAVNQNALYFACNSTRYLILKTIVLASTSPYRRGLLARLGVSFEVDSPVCDETPLDSESAHALVTRLSRDKAQSLTSKYPNGLIIGSDQVATRDGEILGKPHRHEVAVKQLTASSGRTVVFHTGLCVIDTATNKQQCVVENTYVRFRALTSSQIERYLRTEKPYKCAGSFKSEGLGISLFESVSGDDPDALIGLPMIQLVTMLNTAGVSIP